MYYQNPPSSNSIRYLLNHIIWPPPLPKIGNEKPAIEGITNTPIYHRFINPLISLHDLCIKWVVPLALNFSLVVIRWIFYETFCFKFNTKAKHAHHDTQNCSSSSAPVLFVWPHRDIQTKHEIKLWSARHLQIHKSD